MASNNHVRAAQKITLHGFLNEFKRRHEQMEDRPFCWILGSGASVQSRIPTGEELARQWLKELHDLEDFDKRPIEEWATAENLGIPGFDFARAANFYSWIFQRRFRDYKEQGYAVLEKAMDQIEPSFGYSVLAQIMAMTHHKVAITTNFDNLIADALSIHARVFPLVCGHESLTGYIRATMRRPLIAKIHRDLLLDPGTSPQEIGKLPGEWTAALTRIFERFTPIVIGYGGNDGSLMDFLKTLKAIEGGIFWCHCETSTIDPAVHEVVLHHRGRLVPIEGFDEVMLELQEKLQLPPLLPQAQKIDDKRATDHQKQFEALNESVRKSAGNGVGELAAKVAEATVERSTKEKDWRAWQLKADAEPDATKREAIYRAASEDFPGSHALYGNFALFMEGVRKNYDEAEQLYGKAMELDPTDADYAGNFALFMENVRKNHDQAERLYRKALELNPHHANNTGNFAVFMKNVRKDYDEAERLYRKALELDPKSAKNTGSFAAFMENVREDYDEAERLYRKALELEPNHANNTSRFAVFLEEVRADYDEAERLYRRVLELDPNHANNTGNFAVFMKVVRTDYDEAERLYRKAMELDPKQALHTGNFAVFMEEVLKDYDEAERLFKKALEIDPKNEWVLARYEAFRKAHPVIAVHGLTDSYIENCRACDSR